MSRRLGLCLAAIAFVISPLHALGDAHPPTEAELDAKYDAAVGFVKQKQYDKAYDTFRMLSDFEQHDAQYNLATLLRAGFGHPQDFQEALFWAWLSHLGGVAKAGALAEDLTALLPERALDDIRDKVSAHLSKRVEAGDPDAIMHRGDYFLEILAEPDHGQAYVWYAIGAAMRLQGAYQARNTAAENLDPEDLIALQEEAAQIFRGMKARIEAQKLDGS
jgi:TPR repeat protein